MSPSICTPPSFKHTKRGLVSAIYRTYDVLGWISPTTLQMKIMIQQLWKTGHGWDRDIEAPQSAVDSYQKWKEELPVLKEKTIPRCYSVPGYEIQDVTLHGFSDASQTAYGAVVYYRTIYQDHPPTIVLVTSKTKLAKLKTATIPRLELCAALLLAKLLESVGRVLDISPNRWHAWSDSSTVLAWLDGHQRQHPAYVANRVEQTLEITTPYIWHHVPTACNPADCASRGLKPTDLLQHDLWWNGPIWLQQEPMLMPPQPPRRPLPDAGPAVCVLQPTSSIPEQISNLSLNYPNIISTAAWCQRFSQRIQKGRPTPDDRPRRLTVEERKVAEEWLFREFQKRSFPRDISAIQKNKPISRDSRLKTLNPFLDKQQLLRLGGRLKQSDLSPSQKTPIILDGKDPLMEKFFKHLHISLWTGGEEELQELLNHLNSQVSSIKFTMKHSKSTATFLDLKVYKGRKFRETGHLDTKLHIKATNPQSYLHFTSCHPNYIFSNIIRGEILRTLRATSDGEVFHDMVGQLLPKFTNRGYPRELFHRIAHSISFDQREYHLTPKPQQQLPPEVVLFSVPHHPALDYSAIGRITADDHTPFQPMLVRTRPINHGDLLVRARTRPLDSSSPLPTR